MKPVNTFISANHSVRWSMGYITVCIELETHLQAESLAEFLRDTSHTGEVAYYHNHETNKWCVNQAFKTVDVVETENGTLARITRQTSNEEGFGL